MRSVSRSQGGGAVITTLRKSARDANPLPYPLTFAPVTETATERRSTTLIARASTAHLIRVVRA